ncbi:IS200/IS605 family transposase [bacterium]|nr:IS200/IS605 family transposase [bacterium]
MVQPKHIRKSHNVTFFIYHLVCPTKYRRKVFTEDVSQTLKTVCLELGIKYEIRFIEIGIDEDHVHFLLQTIPNIRFSDTVKKIKSITAREIFAKHPEVKTFLWGGNFWTSGYYANTVGRYGNLSMIQNYVKNQGIPNYEQLHSEQPTLFDHLQGGIIS